MGSPSKAVDSQNRTEDHCPPKSDGGLMALVRGFFSGVWAVVENRRRSRPSSSSGYASDHPAASVTNPNPSVSAAILGRADSSILKPESKAPGILIPSNLLTE
jgi:hypothetical protein